MKVKLRKCQYHLYVFVKIFTWKCPVNEISPRFANSFQTPYCSNPLGWTLSGKDFYMNKLRWNCYSRNLAAISPLCLISVKIAINHEHFVFRGWLTEIWPNRLVHGPSKPQRDNLLSLIFRKRISPDQGSINQRAYFGTRTLCCIISRHQRRSRAVFALRKLSGVSVTLQLALLTPDRIYWDIDPSPTLVKGLKRPIYKA